MKDNEIIIYKLLNDVFSAQSYSGIVLNDTLKTVEDAKARAYITKVFYGVIEKSVQFDYIIAKLCEKKPKNNIIPLIKLGLYLLRNTDTPSYAAINKTVSLAKNVGKAGAAGFINAILRKSAEIDLKMQDFATKAEYLSVIYSYPMWIVKRLIAQYGEQETEAFLSYEKKQGTHIRHNPLKISKSDFEDKLDGIALSKSSLGFYVSHEAMRKLHGAFFTPQSYASMLAVKAYVSGQKQLGGCSVLDICAAPGGKSIYLKQLFPDMNITACDIHPHRLKLIEDYAKRMETQLLTVLNDGTVFNAAWEESFDMVICDVPCSGLGLINSKPDIILNKSEESIKSLTALQSKILQTSAKYVKKGGFLCYSTCTVLKEENSEIVEGFLLKNNDFKVFQITPKESFLQLLPQFDDCDGFFIAKLQRV